MGLKLNGSTSGSVALNAPASTTSGADVVLTLPVNDGDADQFLQTNGSGTLTWATETTTNLTRGTVAATTSGTEVDFTSLPTGIRRITLILDSVSVDGANNIDVRLSTGGTFATTGYNSTSARTPAGTTTVISDTTAGFCVLANDNAARVWTGRFTWDNITGDVWVMDGNANDHDGNRSCVSSGRVELSGTLDGLRLFSTSTFDGGQINIIYEV